MMDVWDGATQCVHRAQAGGGRGAGMEGRRRTAVRGGAGDEGDWWRMMLWVSPEGRAVRAATEGGWWWIWGRLPLGPTSTHGGTK